MKTHKRFYTLRSVVIVAALLLNPRMHWKYAPAIVEASFPFYDGFETGTLGSDWTVSTTNQGRVHVSSSYPYAGSYSLLLDDSQNDSTYSIAAAILAINLSGQTQVELDFWWDEWDSYGTGDDPEDGVFISDDDGGSWYRILSFDADPTGWRHQVIDLDAAAANAGRVLNEHFQIKFQFYDDDSIPTDGYSIDEVHVRSAHIPTPASFPYYTGFENGSLGDEWLSGFSNEGRVRVDDSFPYAGTYSLLLDDWQVDSIYSLASAVLAVDLSGQTQVELDFWWDEWDTYGTGDDPEDGVFISDDDGGSWYRILSFDADPTGWRHQVIDLDAAAANAGRVLNDQFQIKFQFYDDDSIPTDGYSIDEVHVRSAHIPTPASFPYYTGFENGSLGDEWLSGFSNEGRVRVDDSFPYAGTYSLLLDDWQVDSIYSLASAVLAVDLSGQAQVELDFWWDEWDTYGTGDDLEDGVFISDDDGASWYRILSFDADPTGWQHQVIDLDEAAANAGRALNDQFQIKFQFYDDDSIPTDGYAFDELSVRPNAAPILMWSGETNYEQDGLHPESGDVGDSYVYKVRYSDKDSDPPGPVQVRIKKGGADVPGSPFGMDCEAGDYEAGVTCSYTKTGFEVGTDYTYTFEAQDDLGNVADPTVAIDAPDVSVTYRTHLSLLMKNAGPPAGAPLLNPIDNPGGNYLYTVSWSAVSRATSYTLEEDDNPDFSSPTTIYSGSAISKTVYASAEGIFYYHVKASNTYGESDWSNVHSVDVTVTPPPCPLVGTWSGSGNHFGMDFEVIEVSDSCYVQNITGHLSAVCHGNGSYWTMYVEFILNYAEISDHDFSTSDGAGTIVDGTFNTPDSVAGTWSYYKVFPYPYAVCSRSGTWTGSYGP